MAVGFFKKVIKELVEDNHKTIFDKQNKPHSEATENLETIILALCLLCLDLY